MTYKEVFSALTHSAAGAYPDDKREAKAVAIFIARELWGLEYTDFLTNPDGTTPVGVSRDELDRVCADISRRRPAQYIAGTGWFGDYRLLLREGVLIPRPETEELVRWITSEYNSVAETKILDIGTGSGAIAIFLAGTIRKADVCAVDISTEAIEIARENARLNDVYIDLRMVDILKSATEAISALPWSKCDVIVSNPPYIPHSDLSDMPYNVTLHEPHNALFVPSDDPLLFYRAIAYLGLELLENGGKLFFECYHKYTAEVCAMLEDLGYSMVEQRTDMFGKPRMVKAVL